MPSPSNASLVGAHTRYVLFCSSFWSRVELFKAPTNVVRFPSPESPAAISAVMPAPVVGSGVTFPVGSGVTFPVGSGVTFPVGSGVTFPVGSGVTFPVGSGVTFPVGSGVTFPVGSGVTFPVGSGVTFPVGSGVTPPPGTLTFTNSVYEAFSGVWPGGP